MARTIASLLRRRAPLGALVLTTLALAACADRDATSLLGPDGPSMQVASAPVVNSLADPGDGTCDDAECTLREAIAFATSGATITFASELSGMITLGTTYLNIAKYLTISGPGADQLAVSGGEEFLVFWITGGHTTISGLTIRDGLGQSSNGGGGVVVTNSGTTATLENCVLENNSAGSLSYQSGGALWMNSGTDVTISSCTLSGNTAPDVGQAIYQYGGSLTILNSTITGHGPGTGKDAIYKYGGTTQIDHSTITGNGVGLKLSTSGSGVSVKGSIISGNTSADVYGSSTGGVTSLGYNLIGTSGTNFNVLPAFSETGDQTGVTDPGLAPLALNSPGSTPTHALVAGSAAIDAGVCTDIDGTTLTVDQRGVTRPQGSACDIGAYEREPVTLQDPTAPVVNTLADHDDGACSTSDCTLREAIGFASSGATITFASSLEGWISLGTSLPALVIDAPLTINGPGASVVAVSGSTNRVLDIQPGGTASVTIRNLTIRDGESDTDGAGIVVRSGTVLLEGVDVLNNRSSSASTFYGGGIAVQGTSAVTVRRSSIRYNNSSYRGAGISVADGSALTVESSAITDNITAGYGGGLYSAGTVTVTNSTIAGNYAYYGAGAFTNGGSLALAFSTVALNNAGTGHGGGVYPLSGSVALTGTILAMNTATNNPDLGGSGSGVTASYTLIETAADAANFGISDGVNGNIVGSGPGFDGGLTTNGGPTVTIALGAASPALDQIPSGTLGCGGAVATDQRGVDRPQGSACDMGAYEKEASGGPTTPEFAFDLEGLSKTYGDAPFSIAGSPYVSTNSTGQVTFALGEGSTGCSVISAGEVTITGAAVDPAACIIEASLAAASPYAAAGPISQSFNIAKAATTVTINNLPASGGVTGGFSPEYTTASDGDKSTTSSTTDVCTVMFGRVSFVGIGTCTLTAHVAEGTNWLAADGGAQNIEISGLAPKFTFDLTGLSKTYGDPPFSVAGYINTNSSGAITFALGAGSTGCTVSSVGEVTITGAALDPSACIIEATLAQSSVHVGAGPISQSFHIAKASPSVSIGNLPSGGVVGDGFTPTVVVDGDGATSVTSSTTDVCTVDGAGAVSFDAAGTCALVGHVAEGTNYLEADGEPQSVTIVEGGPAEFSSSCTYRIHPRSGQMQVFVEWANADPGVSLVELLNGIAVEKELTPTATGTYTANLKGEEGDVSYRLSGGERKKDDPTPLMSFTICTEVDPPVD